MVAVFLHYLSLGNIKAMTKETPNARSFQIHQYFSYKPNSSFTATQMCPPNDIFDIDENIAMLMLALQCKGKKTL